MSVQKTVAKNSIYNILGSFAPVVVTLVTVPLYIDQIGEARYGILALVWLVLGYFGLFDLGLGKAVANQIAYFRKNGGGDNESGKIFWTAIQVNFWLGCAGGFLLYFVGPWAISFLAESGDQLLEETIRSFAVLAIAVPIVTIASVGTGYLEGKENFGIINILQVTQNIIFQLFPLLTAYFYDVSLFYLISAAVSAKILATALLFIVIKSKKEVGFVVFSREKVRELITYGGSITVSNIIGPILTSADRFLIGALAGAKAVTYYTIPYDLSVKIKSITASYSRALFPQFSMLGEEESRDLSYSAVKFLLTVITPGIIIGFLLMHPFLSAWVGEEIAFNSSPVGYIILVGVWLNNLAFIPVTFLTGQKRPGIVALVHTIELVPYLLILWFLTSNYGVEGAAFAWTLRVTVDTVLMFIYSGLHQRVWRSISTTSIIILGCFLLLFYNVANHEYILGAVVVGYLFYGWHQYKTEVNHMISTIKRYFSR